MARYYGEYYGDIKNYRYDYGNGEKILKPIQWNYKDEEDYRHFGIGVLVVDKYEKTIEFIVCRGAKPRWDKILHFILSDKHVRRLIHDYQKNKKRMHDFKIGKTVGMSGREDYYINFYTTYGIQTYGKKLLHISCNGELNKGIDEIYIGDFVELIAHLQKEKLELPYTYTDTKKLEVLPRKKAFYKSKCKYIKELYYENDSTNEVSIII